MKRLDRIERNIELITKLQKELEESIKKTSEQQKRTEEAIERMSEQQKRTEEAIERMSEQQKRTEEAIERMNEQQRKTEEAIEKMSKEIEKMSKEIGSITDGWGKFVEGLAAPAIPKILHKRFGIKTTGVSLNCKKHKNGETMEVDVLVTGNGRKNEGIVIIASIKSRLQRSDVIELINDLKKFHIFFPEYRNCKLQGLVGGIRIDEGVDKYAENIGLYVLGSSGDAVRLLNKPGFKPKIW